MNSLDSFSESESTNTTVPTENVPHWPESEKFNDDLLCRSHREYLSLYTSTTEKLLLHSKMLQT